ncbi:oligopeptide:H+ symporter [Dongshaea marina]|uniref:oligopeptide:H+ symporter n=1 Tax=Dongshaea marina TaxID=2047966 RepID=UPI001F31F30D|nr:oligopeptide:H+ symporter [Dongshaea marina]
MSTHSSLNVFRQPKAFYLTFSIELWERFGFYGVQGILTLFLVHQFKLPEASSFILFGAFTALVYGGTSIGGWLGDNILGTKRVILLGAITLALGYLLLSLAKSHVEIVYLGMGFVAIGNCLFKANPSSLLSKVYSRDDPRLDGAFTMYYMAINIGGFISTLLTPWIAQHYGWNAGFVLCFIGLILTLANFLFCRRWVHQYGSPADFKPVNSGAMLITVAGILICSFVGAWLLQHLSVAHWLLTLISIVAIFIFFKEAFGLRGSDRAKMLIAFILMLEAVIFFILYMQMPTSLNFFAAHNVNHNVLGLSLETAQFQALNPLWIMVASPLLAMLYNKLGDKMPISAKFAIGMLLCSLAFLVLPLGAHFANAQGIISSGWLVASYGFQSVGELMISGLGLSMVAQLVPSA